MNNKTCRITSLPGIFAWAALLFLAAALLPAQAQTAPAPPLLTLEQALELALAYSPNLDGAQQDLEASQGARQEAGSRFLPTLSTNYGYKGLQNPSILKTVLGPIPLAAQHTYQWSTTVTQPIFTGFNLISAYRLADLGVDVAQAQMEGIRLDVILSVKEAYLENLRAQRNLEVARQAVISLASHHQTTKDFFEVGILAQNDVLKAEVELANAQQQEVSAKNALDLARSRLNLLLGRPLSQPFSLVDILGHHPLDLNFDLAREEARRQRPEVRSIELQYSQGQQRVRQAQSGYYPQVNLQSSYIFTSDRPEMGDSTSGDATSWQVVGSLDWTFWDWGRTRAQVSQRRANLRKVEAARRDLLDQIDLQVNQSQLNLEEAEKNIGTAQASIASAQENMRITQERFREQLATNTEVLDAQTLLTRAQTNYHNALAQFNQAEARLERALGRDMAYAPAPPGGQAATQAGRDRP